MTDTWTKHAAPPPSASGASSAGWTGSELVVIPSFEPADRLGATFDWEMKQWSPHANLFPLERRRAYAVAVWMPATEEVLVWGGGRNTCPCDLKNGAAFHVPTGQWRIVADSPLGPISEFYPPGVVWNGSRVVIYGGGSYSGGDRYKAMATYEPITDTWETHPDSPQGGYTRMASLNLGASGELAGFWGGNGYVGSYPTTSGAIWDDVALSWTMTPPLPNDPNFYARERFASWSTGATFGVWGGYAYKGGFFYTDTGYICDLGTATWSVMPPGGPSPRSRSVAVWTGTDVIVWGGDAGGNNLQSDGRIYRP